MKNHHHHQYQSSSNHRSYYFSESLHRTIEQRGLNFITPVSGCHFAAWVYQAGPAKYIECSEWEENPIPPVSSTSWTSLESQTKRFIVTTTITTTTKT